MKTRIIKVKSIENEEMMIATTMIKVINNNSIRKKTKNIYM